MITHIFNKKDIDSEQLSEFKFLVKNTGCRAIIKNSDSYTVISKEDDNVEVEKKLFN